MSVAMMSAPFGARRTAWERPWTAPVMKVTLPSTRPMMSAFRAAGCSPRRRDHNAALRMLSNNVGLHDWLLTLAGARIGCRIIDGATDDHRAVDVLPGRGTPGRASSISRCGLSRGHAADDARRGASGTSGEGEQLAATPGFNQGAIADRVRSELAEHRDRTFLIIDDLHELTSPEALRQLTRLLEKLPRHVHAILATRRSLPLRLHKLRLAGDLAEIGAADLRFAQRETREFLEASGIALSEAGAAKLHQRTEGWAAGLRRSHWPAALTPSDLSRSSPAAAGPLPSTCSPRCWSASRPRSSSCFCVPPCSTASTASWRIC
jgi:hypothetical protein